MILHDSRRLTGPNLLSDGPGAIIDVVCDRGDDLDAFIDAWQHWMALALGQLGRAPAQTFVRRYATGASLAVAAPIDALYAASELNDWVFAAALSPPDADALSAMQSRFAAEFAEEANPPLLALQAAAREHATPFLWDDDSVSLGLGALSRSWPARELPSPAALDWSALGTVPVALITGTNGKTTTTRLLARMARHAGLCAGSSGTDWIAVDDQVLDRGDYSGPGGARTVLRDRRVEIALLETARGGIMRRGLACQRADAALITNIAADHLGEFGLASLTQLADVKWVVSQAVRPHGVLVLNADDPLLLERARDYSGRLAWFSRDNTGPAATAADRAVVEAGALAVYREHRLWLSLPLADIAIAFGGAALHNVDNALAAALLAATLDLPAAAVSQALRDFTPNDNPGRGNALNVQGRQVLIDFAHNPHGVGAFVGFAHSQPAARRLLLIGQAGDRSDEDVRGLAGAVRAGEFDRILVKELADYARGRAPGETADILWQALLELGVEPRRLQRCADELSACAAAMDWSVPGDQLVLLIHASRDAVLNYFHGLAASPATHAPE